MEKWKLFFETSGSDIWTVIDRAITIAAMEHPAGMRQRRDKFTEKMFCPTSHLAGLCECDGDDDDDDRADEADLEPDVSADESDASESKGISRKQQQQQQQQQRQGLGGGRKKSEGAGDNNNDDEEQQLKELSEEMEQEARRMKEISKLKSRIENPDQPDDYLCLDLEALERMQISFEALKATGIGRPVNNLRKHPSASVRATVKRLIRDWKALADEWAKSAEHVTAGVTPGSPDGMDDGYGLPSPPVDEDELLAAGSAPLEVNKLLHFIDDDLSAGSVEVEPLKDDNSPGDWVNGIYEDAEDAESPKPTRGSRKGKTEPAADRLKSRKDNAESNNINSNARGRPATNSSSKASSLPSSTKLVNGKEQQKPLAATSRPRPSAPGSATASSGIQRPKATLSSSTTQRRPADGYTSKSSTSMSKSEEPEKLAAAKRKLQENYQQAENAKKQRTVQVMELTDLPKGKGGPRAAVKPKPQHNNRYTNQSRR